MINVPPDPMQEYIHTAKRCKQQRLAELDRRRLQGLEIAQTAVKVDIDLAVWGLPEKLYFKAVARLLSLSDFDFDLVEVQYASPEILMAIAQGTEL
jgi:hypothetical protein